MLRITEKQDEIVIREMPFVKWSFSALAAVFALALVFGIVSATALAGIAWGFGFFAFGIVIFAFQQINPVTTVRINKPGKTVAVRKQSLIDYSFKVYSFSEIIDYIYVESTDVTSSQIVMPVKDGVKIRLSTTGGSNDGDYLQAADQMNGFIFGKTKTFPFRVTLLNPD